MGLAASRQEAFWEACGFGHIGRAKSFLKEGEIDVNWVSYVNDSCPIHVASQGKPEIVDLLITNNCDVNVKDGRGNLAIHHAAMKGHADIVQKLIDAGSEINTQEKNGWTALHNAAYWCHPDVVHVLLKNNCDVEITNKDGRMALHECARSQDKDDCKLGKVARLLIGAGSDVNAKSSDWGEADLTALMCTAFHNHLKWLQPLLIQKADLTALMCAAFHNHPEVATALIDGKCDIDAIGTTYWTALHWAADRGNEELVYILVEAGADPTKRDLKGETALDRASTDNIREVLTTVTRLHKELQMANTPVIQPVTCLRKPVEPYIPKCDPKFKSQSLLPATWSSSSENNVKNLINEKKSRLAAQTSQTYRQELARRTGTNTITDEEFKKDSPERENNEIMDDSNSSKTCDEIRLQNSSTETCDKELGKLNEQGEVGSGTNSNSELKDKVTGVEVETNSNIELKNNVIEDTDTGKGETDSVNDEHNVTLCSKDITKDCNPDEQQCNNEGNIATEDEWDVEKERMESLDLHENDIEKTDQLGS